MFDEMKVLYLEDEPLVAFDTSEHLQSLGFDDVKVAYKLSQAEAFAEDGDIDLAILDINVDRGQTSLVLGDKLAANGTKVIFASGNGDDAERLQDQGYVFLDKPFSLLALTVKIKALVQS